MEKNLPLELDSEILIQLAPEQLVDRCRAGDRHN